MNIKLNIEQFRNALNKILSVVDKSSSRPILNYSLITAKNNILEISATDLEVACKISIEANIEDEVRFCINAKNISDILKELPNTELELILNQEKNILELNCNEIHFSLVVYNSEEYPHLSFKNNENSFTLDSKNISEMLAKTSFAILNDETRLYLNGIFLQEVDSKLRAVATDGHRLSLFETDLDEGNNEFLINGIIIPKKAINELKKMAESFPDKRINISVDNNFLYVNVDNQYSLSIRLIGREYPKYQAVIPSKTSYTMTADKEALLNSIKRIKIMSNEKSNGVKMCFKNENLTVQANHPTLGEAIETIAVDYNGKDMEIGFNAKYLMDTIQTLDDGEVTFEINNELSPIIIKSMRLPNYLGIVMPLKL